MRIEWTNIAIEDFRDILISADDFGASTRQKLATKIEKAVTQIADFPRSAPVGRADDTRELDLRGFPFVLIYRIDADCLTILSIRNSARGWPASFPTT